ncbi:MAG: MATE family efflux transporter [Alcanivoracaceae bacterium]|nr:MATE family efflux transporter [Alcanivoracaceae bacterium]
MESRSSPLRQEARSQLLLALPILGGQLAQTGNGFVDTVMAGRVSPVDLAAVAVGASIWVPVYLFMTGVLMSATPILSRKLGAKAYHRINPIAQQGLWLSLGLGLLAALVLRSMTPVLMWMEVDAALQPKVTGYLDALSWGMPGAAVFLTLRSYTEAMSHTRPVLLISVIGLLINIPSNYILIYGKLGMPALGGVGCGWATTLVFWCMALMMGGYIQRHPAYAIARLHLKQAHVEARTAWYIFLLGLPVGLSIFFEVSIFAMIALLISSLGPTVVAGHQVALNFTGLLFMIPLSLAIATTVRVGHGRGQGNVAAVRLAVKSAMLMTVVIGVVAGSLLFLLRHQVPWLYSNDSEVRAIASSLLLFAALYQLSDAWQVTVSGALRGFEDTTVPMFITLLAYWGIGLPVGYALALTDLLVPAMGPQGFWIGLLSGLTAAALMLSVRLNYRIKTFSEQTVPR